MLHSSLRLYKEAYSGVSKPMWLLALVMLVNRSGSMVIPFLTIYLTAKGFDLTDAGFVMACFGCGAILGGFFGGKLSDRLGFFRVQFFSLLLAGLLFFVLGYMETLLQISLCIFILSMINESFRPANSAAVAAFSTEANRTRSFSLNRLAVNLGWAIGPAVGGLLASYSYSFLFWVDGLTCIAASFLLYRFLLPYSKSIIKPHVQLKSSKVSAYKDSVFLTGMVLMLLVGMCFFQLFNVVAAFYKKEVQLDEATIGWVLALNGLIIVAVEMVLVYKLEKRNRGMQYIIFGSFLIGLSFLTLLIYKSLFVVLLSTILITFGEMYLFPFINNFWVKRSSENNRGEYAAIFTMTFALSLVLAPTIASWIAENHGFSALWVFNFVVCMVAVFGFWMLGKRLNYE